MRSVLEKHPDQARDYYSAKKMTKANEQKIMGYISSQIGRMGLNSS